MNLSKPFILRPVMTTLIMLAVALWGVFSYFKLPVSALPDVEYPVITVSVSFPGVNPETMAATVATPLEQQFMTIQGIKNIYSSNTLGQTTIILEFEINRNIDLAAVDVQAAIVAARNLLPPDLPNEPTFKKINPSSTPIMYIPVTSEYMTLGELYDYAYTVMGQRISIVEGVAQVVVYGSPMAIRAQVDPAYLSSLNVSLDEVASSIQRENQYQPLGRFDGAYQSSIIYDNGGLFHKDAYESIIIKTQNNAPLRLKNIAEVIESVEDDRGAKRFITKDSNKATVVLAISKQPGANTVKIVEAINKLLPIFKEELPHSLEFVSVFDMARPIEESLNNLQETLIIALFLVVAVIFIYLGKIKETLNPALSMPMSIIATFAILHLFGFSLDNLSLLAIILAAGFIIDDAIVVLENIDRRVEMGQTPLDAAISGSKQISPTIISMTLSLVAVFIPLLFMPGLIGKLFYEFAITLTVVTIMSGIISLTLNPMLCARFIKKNGHESTMQKFSKIFNEKLLAIYQKPLLWSLKHPLYSIGASIMGVIASLALFFLLPKEFLPVEDLGSLMVYVEAEEGTSSLQMDAYLRSATSRLIEKSYTSNIVSISSTPTYNKGLMYIKLVDKQKRAYISEVVKEISYDLAPIIGVNFYIKPIPLIDLNVGNQVRGDYQYLIQSIGSQDLYEASFTLIEAMRKDPVFESVSSDLELNSPQINLEIQRDLASSLGISAQDLQRALSLSYSGNWVTRMKTPINQYDVIVELLRDLQNDPSSLARIYVKSPISSAEVPLNALVKIKERVGPQSINHFSQFPAVSINFNLSKEVALSEGLERLYDLSSTILPASVIGSVKGTLEAFEETYVTVVWLLLGAIVAIYIILGILYESFIHPITILTTLPPAIFGGLVTLLILQEPFSLYAFLGLILLIGIVKKNGIMMVDVALENTRHLKQSAHDSIYHACLVRFRPIMMTTFAAIVGALPIALGSDLSRRGLGFVIIGGLVVAQLVTLFVTPVFYLEFEKLREKLEKRRNLTNN